MVIGFNPVFDVYDFKSFTFCIFLYRWN